jgi:glyoxylase-like metal-dependent hydrolase (beta-lactamase superfamily II)
LGKEVELALVLQDEDREIRGDYFLSDLRWQFFNEEVKRAEMTIRSVRVISDGVIKFDGGTMFGQLPKVDWETRTTTDRKNRITLGLNCLLIQVDDKNVLVDAGVGAKEMSNEKETYGLVPSKLMKGLRNQGISPKEIDAVILTHLHFDHSGGCTRLDRAGNLVPTFPRAKYFVQSGCWEEANSPNERCQHMHRSEDFHPIMSKGQLELLDGDTEIFPGLWGKVTNGHAKGHQVVTVHHGGERIAFLGDLVPTHHHIDLNAISAFDQVPEDTFQMKREFLDKAEREGWLLIFAHGNDQKAGYLERRNNQRGLRPVEL